MGCVREMTHGRWPCTFVELHPELGVMPECGGACWDVCVAISSGCHTHLVPTLLRKLEGGEALEGGR
eukprot:4546931-Pleurochrysis_carterae.AAC.1